MKSILNPRSIAVVGGSSDIQKPGGRVVLNLKNGGFSPLWVVNARGDEVQGLPTFKTVEALPQAPDLGILAVPAPHVLPAVDKLIALGTRAFLVLSNGFSEVGAEGKALEKALVARIQEVGAVLVGPNSMGVFSPAFNGLFGGPPQTRVAGTVDVVSASGATAVFIMEQALERGMRFASLVSVGNSALYGVEDFLAYEADHFDEAPGKVKLLYMESVKAPLRLLDSARKLRAHGCRLVALKTGATEAGSKAASSHTGAMASRDAAVSALFEKAGIIRVDSRMEVVDTAGFLSALRPPEGPRMAIVTHAGGPGVALADELCRQGFQVPELSEQTQARLLKTLQAGSAVHNPIDFLASGTAQNLRDIFTILGEEEQGRIDGICVIFGSPGLFDIYPVLEVILEAIRTNPIPVYPVLPSTVTAASEMVRFREQGQFFFSDEVSLARTLGRVWRAPGVAPLVDELPALDEARIRQVLEEAKARGQRQLEPQAVMDILVAAGFTLPGAETVSEEEAAVAALGRMGAPVVMKVVGPVHKTDVGGVVLGVREPDAVRTHFRKLMAIEGATGVLVQEQVSGLELILGTSREEGFGHLVLFGMGGIFTEALHDVKLALAPLSPLEAGRLMDGIRSAALLKGVRGQPGADRAALTDALVRLSALVTRFPEIKEMDINPLMARGPRLLAVDARMEIG